MARTPPRSLDGVTGGADDDPAGTFASPPCLLHEVDPAYSGLPPVVDPTDWAEVKRWRARERQRLIAARLALSGAEQRQRDAAIAARLDEVVGEATGLVVSAYWPVRGETDLRPFLQRLAVAGARTALPVVVGAGRPLVFRAWTPGRPVERGAWGIPTPPGDAEAVVPDIVIVPLLGFDRACHRLGYGGGFFDRTLAAMPNQPRILGVGYGQAVMATIYPQPHDVPMQLVVTDERTIRRDA
jgi:5,10-methenyltetrahydrofolate synthetase